MELRFTGDPGPILARLAGGLVDDPTAFALRRQAEEQAVQRDGRRLRALADGRIQLFPHQEKAVWRVLKELRGRAILADGVGLGKTIEAGTILKEYMLRGLVQRALILVPPGLIPNWRAELARLGLPVDDQPLGGGQQPPVRRGAAHPAPGLYPVWLVSLARARVDPWAALLCRHPWDMVVVDEAHRLQDPASRSWQLVSGLQSRFLLLLTATPLQNDLKELYTLITLLKPGQLGTYAAFRRRFMVDRHAVRDVGKLRGLLSQVVVRTSRREAGIGFPARRLELLPVPHRPQEQAAYEAVLQLAREAYRRLGQEGVHLLPYLQLLRQGASHPWAGVPTVMKMMEARRRGEGGWPPAGQLEEVLAALRQVGNPTARMERLGAWLDGVGRREKVIIFTEFRAVQRILARWLEARGWRCQLVYGGQGRAGREAALRAFAGPDPVLVSTDAGSEGHNWQWARTVVNFDLPWNPMRIEQRVGRVYRLGQTRDVQIVNLVAPGTVEAYVVDLLHRKLDMFGQAIGDLDDVLGKDGEGLRKRLVEVILGPEGPEGGGQARRRLEEEVGAWAARQRAAANLWDGLWGAG